MPGFSLASILDRFRPAPLPDGPRPGDVVVYGTDDRNGNGRRDAGEIGHVGILSYVPGVTIPDPPSVVEARRWIGQGIYSLGAGGRNPKDGTPFDREGRADCSGFVCHVLGIDRFEDGRWWNTDAILRDGKVAGGRWEPVPMSVDLARCKVIHCRSGRPAVVETSGKPWARRGAIVRLA